MNTMQVSNRGDKLCDLQGKVYIVTRVVGSSGIVHVAWNAIFTLAALIAVAGCTL